VGRGEIWVLGTENWEQRLPRPTTSAYMYLPTKLAFLWHPPRTDFTSSGKRKRPVGLHWTDRVGANSNQLPSGDNFLNDGYKLVIP